MAWLQDVLHGPPELQNEEHQARYYFTRQRTMSRVEIRRLLFGARFARGAMAFLYTDIQIRRYIYTANVFSLRVSPETSLPVLLLRPRFFLYAQFLIIICRKRTRVVAREEVKLPRRFSASTPCPC